MYILPYRRKQKGSHSLSPDEADPSKLLLYVLPVDVSGNSIPHNSRKNERGIVQLGLISTSLLRLLLLDTVLSSFQCSVDRCRSHMP